ncbi:hypothetical protein Tco_0281801 [Tanacetum coccineum]
MVMVECVGGGGNGDGGDGGCLMSVSMEDVYWTGGSVVRCCEDVSVGDGGDGSGGGDDGRIYLEAKHTVRGDGVANYKRRRQSDQGTGSWNSRRRQNEVDLKKP